MIIRVPHRDSTISMIVVDHITAHEGITHHRVVIHRTRGRHVAGVQRVSEDGEELLVLAVLDEGQALTEVGHIDTLSLHMDRLDGGGEVLRK